MTHKGKEWNSKGKIYLYSVWNNKTGQIICSAMTAGDAAKAMGVSESYFYQIVWMYEHGKTNKWYVKKISADEEANMENPKQEEKEKLMRQHGVPESKKHVIDFMTAKGKFNVKDAIEFYIEWDQVTRRLNRHRTWK